MSKNQAGKGDKPRPVVKKQFDKNYEEIVWTKNKDQQGVTKKNKTVYKYQRSTEISKILLKKVEEILLGNNGKSLTLSEFIR